MPRRWCDLWGQRAHFDRDAIELNISFKSVLNMYDLEIGATALKKKKKKCHKTCSRT